MNSITPPKCISVFYPSLKVKVKVVSVNMKKGTMNWVFVAIFLLFQKFVSGNCIKNEFAFFFVYLVIIDFTYIKGKFSQIDIFKFLSQNSPQKQK